MILIPADLIFAAPSGLHFHQTFIKMYPSGARRGGGGTCITRAAAAYRNRHGARKRKYTVKVRECTHTHTYTRTQRGTGEEMMVVMMMMMVKVLGSRRLECAQVRRRRRLSSLSPDIGRRSSAAAASRGDEPAASWVTGRCP